MAEAVDYLDVDQNGPFKVRCMNGCNTVIAEKTIIKTSVGEKEILRHNVMSTRYPVKIIDGTTANMLVCKKCLKKGNFNLTNLEATMYKGWEKTQDAVYKNHTKNEYDKAMQRVTDMKNLKKIVGA